MTLPLHTATALDTAHSAVVEACAGSGKAWLLTSPFGLIFPDIPDAITI